MWVRSTKRLVISKFNHIEIEYFWDEMVESIDYIFFSTYVCKTQIKLTGKEVIRMSTTQKFNMSCVESKLNEFSANKFWADSSAVITSTLLSSWEKRGTENFKSHKLVFRKSKRANLLFKLAIMSWYVNDETGFVVREAIYPLVQKDSSLIHIKVSLISKKMMLKVLEDELTGLHPNQIFGNFLNKNEWSEVFFTSQ
jgi:hypothetical protein